MHSAKGSGSTLVPWWTRFPPVFNGLSVGLIWRFISVSLVENIGIGHIGDKEQTYCQYHSRQIVGDPLAVKEKSRDKDQIVAVKNYAIEDRIDVIHPYKCPGNIPPVETVQWQSEQNGPGGDMQQNLHPASL